MQLAKDGHSIVIAGAWNAAIFSPNWVAEHLAETEQVGIPLVSLREEHQVEGIPSIAVAGSVEPVRASLVRFHPVPEPKVGLLERLGQLREARNRAVVGNEAAGQSKLLNALYDLGRLGKAVKRAVLAVVVNRNHGARTVRGST